jgi:hypothetical protein
MVATIQSVTTSSSYPSFAISTLRFPGEVYCGGSLEVFQQLTGSTGEDVLFTGDHIFGDILKSKRKACWRTLLVIPELVQELHVWTSRSNLFDELVSLDNAISDLYRRLDSNSKEKPDVTPLRQRILVHSIFSSSLISKVKKKVQLRHKLLCCLLQLRGIEPAICRKRDFYAKIRTSFLRNSVFRVRTKDAFR